MRRTEDRSCFDRSRLPDRHEASLVPGHGKRRLKGGAAPIPRPKRRKTRGGGHRSRPWVFSSRDFSSCKKRFVIVSYNILGVENASRHPDLYQLVDPKNLEWDRRKRRIRKELRRYDPSILCFQEVDRFDDLASLLNKDGYVGVYQVRTGDASDGCAMFWKEEQFTLLHEENIQFQEFGLRNNVSQICVFKVIDTHKSTKPARSQCDRTLLVGNIHVLFNPNRGDVKLGQMRLFLEKAHEISEQWGNAPVVVAGDLNSMPQSALYQFVSNSKLDFLMHDRRNISGQIKCSFRRKSFAYRRGNRGSYPASVWKCGWSDEERLLAAGNKEQDLLEHPLRLRSAYPGVPGSNGTRDGNGEPLLTSYHSKFMGTVDYIWHSAGLVPVGVVETPPISALREAGCLPSERWGSDHLALVCDFAFVDDDEVDGDDGDDVGASKVSRR